MNNWKKKFIIIWSGQLFSILSSSVAQFAVVLWISLETGSAEVLSIATLMALLPQIILGPFAGVYVDRWNRKWTMILADSFVALCSALIALLFYLDVVELWHIYVLLMLRSVGSAFHSPAMKSSIPLLAPASQLTRIASVNQTIQSICSICGPVLGAALILHTDMSVVMMLDVAGAIIACTALLFVTIPNPKEEESKEKQQKNRESVLQDMKEGFLTIRNNRGLSGVMVTEVLITFFIMPVVALLPLMTLKNFSGTPYEVSLIELLFGVGALIGGIILGVWNPRIRKVVMINTSCITLGMCLAISGLLPGSAFLFYAALTVIQGIAIPFYSGPFTALLQTQIAPAFLGRAFALFDSISLLPAALALLGTGFLADAIGIANIFVICGAATMLVGGIALFIPSIMNLERKQRP